MKEQVRTMLRYQSIRKKKRGIAFWFLLAALVLFLLRWVPGIGPHIHLSPWIALVVGSVAALPALFRWMRWRLLWRLRNRLIVTYALIGLTPIVLSGLLAAIAAYVLFGQFANFAATSEINSELVGLAANTDALALHFQQELAEQNLRMAVIPQAIQLPAAGRTSGSQEHYQHSWTAGGRLPGWQIAKTGPAPGHAITTVPTPPAWVHGSFSGLILSGNQVYFTAITREPVGPDTVSVITGLRLDPQFLGRVVSGLGSMTLWPKVHLQTKLPAAKQHPEFSVSTDSAAKQDANDRGR